MPGVRPHTIKLILRKKIEGLLVSIEDPTIREMFRNNLIISGGAITSLLLGEKPNDYDIYFKTEEAVEWIAKYYASKFVGNNDKRTMEVRREIITNIKGEEEPRITFFIRSSGVIGEEEKEYKYFEQGPDSEGVDYAASLTEEAHDWLTKDPDEVIEVISLTLKADKKPYRPIFFTDNAVSLSNKVQIIIRFWGSTEEIHKNFDFVHAQCWYDYQNDKLELPKESLESILTKGLVYNGSLYPLASLFRIRKFMRRGWRISAGQVLKIAMQVSKLDLTDKKVLREQLIGVDQAYMNQLIMRLSEAKASDLADTSYVAALIDTIFDD